MKPDRVPDWLCAFWLALIFYSVIEGCVRLRGLSELMLALTCYGVAYLFARLIL